MAEIKTKANDGSVIDFLAGLPEEQQKDSQTLIEMMSETTGKPPVMWGTSIIGFDTMKYTTADGKSNDWMRIGFSPRKGKLSLYLTVVAEKYKKQLDDMGKYKTGKGCIYINKLSDVDTSKLKELIATTYQDSFNVHA